MATNPASIEDIEAMWRPLSEQETINATALLAAVWARVKFQVPGVEANLDSEALDPILARAVLVAAVLRVLRNPEGLRQQQIDDYSYTRDTALSSGELYLSDDELALLGAPKPRARSMNTSSRFGGTSWA